MTDDAAAPKHGAIGHLGSDEELQQAVCQVLIEDAELDGRQIRVRVAQGTVVLSGRPQHGRARPRHGHRQSTTRRGGRAWRRAELRA